MEKLHTPHSLNVCMVADMLLAVAMIAAAPGAVAEFQVRVGYIRFAADRAPVGIGSLGLGNGGFIGTGGREGDDLGLRGLSGSLGFALPEKPTGIGTPGDRDHIHNILAEEQEVVCQSNDREKIVGEGIKEEADKNDDQIKQREDPGFYRYDKEQQEACMGIHGGIAEEQAHVQVVNICRTVEQHTVDIHQDHAGEIKQVELKGSPLVFHGTSQRKVAQQTDHLQERIGMVAGEGVGDQPPYLSLQNG